MSADLELRADAQDEHTQSTSCAICWREGKPVRIAGETEVDAILCETHRKAYLGVSS